MLSSFNKLLFSSRSLATNSEDTKAEGTNGTVEETPAEGTGTKDGETVAIDYTIEMAHSFLLDQVKLATETTRPVRGPYLARLELLCQLKRRGGVIGDCDGIGRFLVRTHFRYFAQS